MQEAVPVGEGAMAAILGLDEAGVAQACQEAAQGEVVSPANLNAPGQVVIAGTAAAVARAGERAKALGAKRVDSAAGERAVPLRADEAGGGSAGAGAARGRRAGDPRVPVVANVDAEPKRTAAAAHRRARRSRCRRPCAGRPSCGALRRKASPHMLKWVRARCCRGLVKKIARDATVLNVQAPRRSGSGRGMWLQHAHDTATTERLRLSPARRAASGARLPSGWPARGATVVCVARGANADDTAGGIVRPVAGGGHRVAVDVTDAA